MAGEFPSRSPFEPEVDALTPVPPTPGVPLELRGIVSTKRGYWYGIYDPTKKESVWVSNRQPSGDYAIEAHDVDHNTVTVQYQGHRLVLTLKDAAIGPVAGGESGPADALAVGEARSRVRVAEIKKEIEIRRELRRALRQERLKR